MTRVAVAVLLVAVATAAHADKLVDIRGRGRLIVSVKNDAQHPHKDPAHFDKRGFEVELAHALAKKIVGDASKLELRMLARPVRLPMLAAGNVDLVVSMIPATAENAAQVDFSHPYFASGLSLLVKQGTARMKLGDLDGKTIAFRRQSFNDHGGELTRLAAARGIKVAVRWFSSTTEAAEAVAKGEVAAMGGNFVDLDAYRKEHPGFAVDAALLDEQTVAVAVKKGEPELLRAVNETIDGLRQSGDLKRLTAKWHLPYLLP
ncbi:MAG TPA: transporter substrate-binding domain-containing protein [Polyangia bacterium]|nr:transporter substrate-binding domain-containing protein [Polyangia bacterium]